ncbi:MAG: hypothetical protein NVSMB3_05580 [Acidobacteriaceae bacterium]
MNVRAFCNVLWARPGLALACVVCLHSPAALASKPDSVPDWVRSAAAKKLPSYPSDTDAVVLLDDTTYSVAADGHATEHCRRVLRILRPQGRDAGIVFVPYDGDSKLMSLHVWSIGPDGHEFAVKDNEIIEYGYPGQGNFYADVKARVARAPGRDPGGVVAYEYEQGIHPYLTEITWFFQSTLPHLSQSFTLELPAGFTFGTVWAHHAEIKPVDLEHQRFRWEISSTPGIDLNRVPMTPSEAALSGRMTLHYAGPGIPLATDGSWQSIGQWYGRLSQDRLVPSPEASAKAKELTGGAADFYDRVEPIAEFVQKEIRYFVIERGIGGQQPHFASEIFRNRYGDCKDKATLLSAMLSAVGVHSALVMVDHRRGVIDPDAPSIVGDHMIAAIEIPAGYSSPRLRSVVTSKSGRRYLIFDPTWEKTAFGQLEHNLQGSYGVLIEGAESQIVRLPVLAPELNTVRRSASFRLQPDGSLQGTVIEKRFGDLSERRRELSLSGNARQQSDFLDRLLAQDFPNFSLANVSTENAAALNKELTTSFAISANGFARSMGPLLMLRPRVLGTDDLHPDREPRVVPIDLSETLEASDDFDIELPAGYVVDELPDPVSLDVGFASYQSSSRLEKNVLHYKRIYTVRQVSLPADRYPDLQRLAGAIAADEQSNAVLRKQ